MAAPGAVTEHFLSGSCFLLEIALRGGVANTIYRSGRDGPISLSHLNGEASHHAILLFCWCLLFMAEILQQLIFFLRPKFNRIPLCRVIKPKMEEKLHLLHQSEVICFGQRILMDFVGQSFFCPTVGLVTDQPTGKPEKTT